MQAYRIKDPFLWFASRKKVDLVTLSTSDSPLQSWNLKVRPETHSWMNKMAIYVLYLQGPGLVLIYDSMSQAVGTSLISKLSGFCGS